MKDADPRWNTRIGCNCPVLYIIGLKCFLHISSPPLLRPLTTLPDTVWQTCWNTVWSRMTFHRLCFTYFHLLVSWGQDEQNTWLRAEPLTPRYPEHPPGVPGTEAHLCLLHDAGVKWLIGLDYTAILGDHLVPLQIDVEGKNVLLPTCLRRKTAGFKWNRKNHFAGESAESQRGDLIYPCVPDWSLRCHTWCLKHAAHSC